MEIRRFNSLTDYQEVCQWWDHFDFAALPLDALPKLGYIVESTDKKVCAAWLYKTDSSFAIMEWFISNPSSDKIERDKSLELLMTTILEEAKKNSVKYIFTSVQLPGLMDRLESHGFMKTDTNMTNLIRRL